ncbi:hypothetical protein CLD22_16800 [Rubrivivax gelatinosus]|nr:hypothetical protein [Rubrivivax gelatinosus]
MEPQSQKIILDVDARIETLISEINATPNSGASATFVDDFQGMLADKLLGPFGLSRSMFSDVDGGAVTSLRNFEKGVVANDADAARHKAWKQAQTEVFDRGDYDKALNNAGLAPYGCGDREGWFACRKAGGLTPPKMKS